MKHIYSFLIILFCLLPHQAAISSIPHEYVGHWRGLFCEGGVQTHTKVGAAATVAKDIGHKVTQFEFDIKKDGTITGRGVASFWFNIFADANLLVTKLRPMAYLEDKVQKVEFDIEGRVYDKGIFLAVKTPEKLRLNNAGKKQFMEVWNVFSSNIAKLSRGENDLFLGWSGVIKGLGMDLAWKAIKEVLEIYEIQTPGPNNSFISIDEVTFHGRAGGSPELSEKIEWMSEDGRVDNIDSGTLNPATLKNSPDYPREPPLKPDPPPAPGGRKGRLSYKVMALVVDEQEMGASVLIQQDELDQLRQEYVDMNKQDVPARERFTQSGGIYNTGDYSWAIVHPKVIEGYEIIARNYAPQPATINSAYRNPTRNARIGGAQESRHIYGDALDIQTVPIGHAWPPNKQDWEILAEAAIKANPIYIEEFDDSGAGHIHVDWRPSR